MKKNTVGIPIPPDECLVNALRLLASGESADRVLALLINVWF